MPLLFFKSRETQRWRKRKEETQGIRGEQKIQRNIEIWRVETGRSGDRNRDWEAEGVPKNV